MQWNKRGSFFQVTTYRVYGAINLNRAALLSPDAGCYESRYLQRIGKNEGQKKPVISSSPAAEAELHVTAIYLGIDIT